MKLYPLLRGPCRDVDSLKVFVIGSEQNGGAIDVEIDFACCPHVVIGRDPELQGSAEGNPALSFGKCVISLLA